MLGSTVVRAVAEHRAAATAETWYGRAQRAKSELADVAVTRCACDRGAALLYAHSCSDGENPTRGPQLFRMRATGPQVEWCTFRPIERVVYL
eukprot:11359881-Alexandrium_andersonii.AAC.1